MSTNKKLIALEVLYMQASKLIGWGAGVLLTTLLSACNLGAAPPPTIDPAAIQTEAMQTVNAQFVVGQSQLHRL
jgi:hypothetical protein